MEHERFERWLDDYVDGTLPNAERAELEAHIASCADCTAALARLRALLAAARQLPPAVPPARDLWPELRERLAAEEAAGLRAARSSTTRDRGRRHLWHPAVGLAAAAALVLVAASVWYMQRADRRAADLDVAVTPGADTMSVTRALEDAPDTGVLPAVVAAFERECMGAGKTLQASLEGRNTPADEAMLRSVAAGIETLDESIAETRAALASNVDDVALMKLLTVRYQQKLSLLQGAIAIVEEV